MGKPKFLCIVRLVLCSYWQVIYNEGWGQEVDAFYPEIGLTALIRSLDPTRLINSVTGWFDHGAGDFSVSIHMVTCMGRVLSNDAGQPPLRESAVRHPFLLDQLVSV